MKYKGYKGKILTVDLGTGAFGLMPLTDEMVELYLGGRGLATRILYGELKPGIAPFSAENKVLFITGPAAGVLAHRLQVVPDVLQVQHGLILR